MVDKVRRWFSPGRLVAVAFVANMAVVGIVWWAQGRDDDNQDDQITAIVEARTEARLTGCEQENRLRLVIQRQAVALASPEALARVEAEGGARLQQALDYLLPLLPQRVCTPSAIADYYESGGVEGVVPLDLPAHVRDFLARHG